MEHTSLRYLRNVEAPQTVPFWFLCHYVDMKDHIIGHW
jgi:hypothetical protein